MPTPSRRAGAYRSRLAEHYELIRVSLDAGVPYRAIRERLAGEFGLVCSLSTLASFIKRRSSPNWAVRLQLPRQSASASHQKAVAVSPVMAHSPALPAANQPKKFHFSSSSKLHLRPPETHHENPNLSST